MQEALRLASKGGHSVSPNPMVGAVLVKRGIIVARGYHRYYGGPHAEVECLAKFKGSLEDTTLYVTLEPCSHYGKTPACAPLLAMTPIPHIVIAMKDPNPLVAGKGITLLRRAGKRVEVGLKQAEAELLNRRYARSIVHSRPYIHIKVAQTLDGRISVPGDTRRWITGGRARLLVHTLRADHDAVLVGARTVLIDNPRLNVRGVKGVSPDVVILDGSLSLPESARVFGSARKRRVFVCTTVRAARTKQRALRRLENRGVIIVPLPGRNGKINIADLLERLYQEHMGSLLVEGGGEVFRQFVEGGFIDELSLFIAPRIGAGGPVAFGSTMLKAVSKDAATLSVRRIDADILIHAQFD